MATMMMAAILIQFFNGCLIFTIFNNLPLDGASQVLDKQRPKLA